MRASNIGLASRTKVHCQKNYPLSLFEKDDELQHEHAEQSYRKKNKIWKKKKGAMLSKDLDLKSKEWKNSSKAYFWKWNWHPTNCKVGVRNSKLIEIRSSLESESESLPKIFGIRIGKSNFGDFKIGAQPYSFQPSYLLPLIISITGGHSRADWEFV